jgi:hypothetical protein
MMTLVLGISTDLFNGTLRKTLRERIGELLWTGHFNRSAFVKNRPDGIAPNRLEAHGADCSSSEAHRLHIIA